MTAFSQIPVPLKSEKKNPYTLCCKHKKSMSEQAEARYPSYSVLCDWWVCSSCWSPPEGHLCYSGSPSWTCPACLQWTTLSGQQTWGYKRRQHEPLQHLKRINSFKGKTRLDMFLFEQIAKKKTRLHECECGGPCLWMKTKVVSLKNNSMLFTWSRTLSQIESNRDKRTGKRSKYKGTYLNPPLEFKI